MIGNSSRYKLASDRITARYASGRRQTSAIAEYGSSTSAHVRHIRNGQDRVAICQVDGPRWSTVEGIATVHDSPDKVAEGERLYAARYRVPRPNPARVVIEISVTKVLGSSAFTR